MQILTNQTKKQITVLINQYLRIMYFINKINEIKLMLFKLSTIIEVKFKFYNMKKNKKKGTFLHHVLTTAQTGPLREAATCVRGEKMGRFSTYRSTSRKWHTAHSST